MSPGHSSTLYLFISYVEIIIEFLIIVSKVFYTIFVIENNNKETQIRNNNSTGKINALVASLYIFEETLIESLNFIINFRSHKSH